MSPQILFQSDASGTAVSSQFPSIHGNNKQDIIKEVVHLPPQEQSVKIHSLRYTDGTVTKMEVTSDIRRRNGYRHKCSREHERDHICYTLALPF